MTTNFVGDRCQSLFPQPPILCLLKIPIWPETKLTAFVSIVEIEI